MSSGKKTSRAGQADVRSGRRSKKLTGAAPAAPLLPANDDGLVQPLTNAQGANRISARQDASKTASARRSGAVTHSAPKTSRRKNPAQPKLGAPVRIFQIYFEPWQRDLLDDAFVPFDNSGVKSELLEFDVFERLAKSPEVEGAELWGALSWRFAEKTGLSGADLLAQIAANPGFDIYFCNPHVHNEALYHNLWVQGETAHPRFLEVCKAVFKAAGLPASELATLQPSSAFSSANYFVGTPKFWSTYAAFVRAVLTAAERHLAPDMKALLHSTGADNRGLHGGATYVPFIVERLFPLFMRTVGKELKGHKIKLPERDNDANVHLRLLREMKDVAHNTKSAWLAACWVNYRALYLAQMHGQDWCKRYLRAVTPTEIKFA